MKKSNIGPREMRSRCPVARLSSRRDKVPPEFLWERFLRAADNRLAQFVCLAPRTPCENIGHEDVFWPKPSAVRSLPSPVPRAEGKTWVRLSNGDPVHPLVLRAMAAHAGFSHAWRRCNQENRAMAVATAHLEDELRWIYVKLAAALNHVVYAVLPERGFVVAYLKRALKPLHACLRHIEMLIEAANADTKPLCRLRCDLLDLREHILRLMRLYRK